MFSISPFHSSDLFRPMLFFPSGIFYSRNSIQNVHTASRPKLQSAFTQTHNPHNLTHTKMHVASSDEESNLPMEAMTIASSDEEHMITRSAFGDRYMRVASSDDESDLSRLVSTSVDIRRSGFKLVHVLSSNSLMGIDSNDAYDLKETYRSRNSSCTTVVVDSDDQENFYDVVRLRCNSIHQHNIGSGSILENEVIETGVIETVIETEAPSADRFSKRKHESPNYLCDKETEGDYNDVNTSMVFAKQRTTMDAR